MASHKREALSIRSRLLQEMRQGVFASAHRLPPENELCGLLGVSRTQLRDSLAQLDREGFISRCHGVGTIINRHVLELSTRMDIEVEFMDMVRQSGYTPEARLLGTSVEAAGPEAARQLRIAPEDRCLFISKLITADGRGAIYCQDIIDCEKIRDHFYTEEVFVQPVFYFLQHYCGLTPLMDVTTLQAVAADERLAGILGVAAGEPLLYMDEVDYDRDGAPILYARQYYVNGIVKHALVRKKL
ncbi:MAG: GntR family transcriptional regulator [Firmicutes bacterium]|nr:GntR family transcriptional regulator [Bacillota bacterium]